MPILVSVSLGSNIEPDKHIRQAIEALQAHYGGLTISPVYQTAAVGFDGEDFLNLVVSFSTNEDVHDVVRQLKSIEDSHGRQRDQPKFSSRTIDLDLLTYADLVIDEPGLQIPRGEILQNAFVLKPLSDILGDQQHPRENKTYRELWQQMALHADRIEPYELILD